MRLMEVKEEVKGIVVEIEGTDVEGEAEVFSAIGAGIDCCSDTMKRINLSLKNCNNGVHTMKHSVRSYKLREEKERKFREREKKKETKILEE